MREVHGDLWPHPCPIKVITTNGDINAKGAAVMGRGVALQAKTIVPGIEFMLAARIRKHGNHCGIVARQARLDGQTLIVISFPVKHHWHERANLDLIERSAIELVAGVDRLGFPEIVMPRPGCGNGGLEWETEAAKRRTDDHPPIGVKDMIKDILDDRFVVVKYK